MITNNKLLNQMSYQNMSNNSPRLTINDVVKYVMSIIKCNSEEYDRHNDEPKEIKILDSNKSESLEGINGITHNIFEPYLPKILYHGILTTILFEQTKKNISLFSSVLSCLLDRFNDMQTCDQHIYITRFVDKMMIEVRKKDGLQRFLTDKFLFHKKDLLYELKNYEQSNNVISFIATYFGINIFIINDTMIDAFYTGYNFNKYKCNIILIKHIDNFLPLSYNNKKIWIFSDPPFDDLINVYKKYIKIYFQPGSTIVNHFVIDDDHDITFNKKNNDVNRVEDIFIRSDENEKIPIISEMIVPVDTNHISVLLEKVIMELYNQLKIHHIKQLAKLHNIRITEKINGKVVQKSKRSLIRELHKIN